MNEPFPDAASCVDRLKVVAETTRLAVLELLLDGPRHVGELNDVLRIDQSLLSHHLRVLRDAGLVTATRDGKSVRYSLAPDVRPDEGAVGLDLGCCRLTFD